ncbi:hypothetical protein [Methylosinus sp. Ce-a6]|uniref:hypothetical protein n=1 Tax=Methylosinus sp. Ce-a6 TaxID=2172005 RepID=UPI00135B5505|nr:hypothetical protein [Methylosinus sp. Ce-a6]
MLIPISLTSTNDIVAETEAENVGFDSLGLTEAKIEEFLRKNVRLLFDEEEDDETLLIVGQQVVNLKGARNDLVALDGNGNLVLIEVKRDAADMASRTEAMEFQAVRYAASLATVATVDDLVERVFARYIRKWEHEFDLRGLTFEELGKRIVNDFLSKNSAAQSFNKRQRILLVSSTFDEQTLSAAAWMSANGIDISCISLNPIRAGGSSNGPLYLAAERLIPTKKIEDFYIEFRERPEGSGESVSAPDTKKGRTNLPRMSKLMEWGIVAPGMRLTLKGFADSEAIVKDAKSVEFAGETMSFNEWGTKVTGWSAICIYDWAVTPGGETLAALRAQKLENVAKKTVDTQMTEI